ncbi:monosaccharide ABC transporter substrate-binding protein, CUT2 family [Paramicrobacterium humi]|uniref:Monosaccharide ABC transporter substrate-binding protein, CUT2 family n=1 Tax=Paramicrobacterium humi TaxID=640635 RepID=A0A1H4NYV8_9MICO|nr:substrate-binding domain-containing protein [Microbacterium humi]SEB99852.1 monosaccharide ABC transporter substrate-binding protein, CUT2 family [Microbacterium humi]
MKLKKYIGVATVLATTALVVAGCSGTSGSTSSGSTTSSSHTEAPLAATSATSFKRDFSSMDALKPLVSKGSGSIAVILPDTVTSARYTEFDAPYLTKAFTEAGLSSDQFTVQNAQGSDATQLTDAQSAISDGAKVIVVDPLDKGVGAKIESYAKQRNVQVIDYDRLTLGGTRAYYVSFDNVKVGELIGNGLVQCAKSWGVDKPSVIEMKGDPTDNNATLFAQGYDSVLNPLYSSGGWTKAAEPAGTWDPPTAATEFTQAFTAHSDANAALVPNDENAAPIITYLKNHGVKAKTFPVTGQDATLVGLQNILSGYQCGTAYKPIYLEAQAAAALALYLRAGETPPSGLVNGTTDDTTSNTKVPSVLLKPEWVTTDNMNSTVIADKFVTAKQLCTKAFADACSAAGIATS